jgi:hypothetical protein
MLWHGVAGPWYDLLLASEHDRARSMKPQVEVLLWVWLGSMSWTGIINMVQSYEQTSNMMRCKQDSRIAPIRQVTMVREVEYSNRPASHEH